MHDTGRVDGNGRGLFPAPIVPPRRQASPRKEAWQPRADVYRMPGGWLVKLELAGVRPEEIRLTVRGAR